MGGEGPREPRPAGVYVCDLAPGLTEEDLFQVFGHHGEVLCIEQVGREGDEAAVIGFAENEAADDAQNLVNLASVRGKTCRCLSLETVEVIRRTMGSGQRLVLERLDPAIRSIGLRDVCSLFGRVLDSKVETDEEERSLGLGFVHYSREEEAAKASVFLGGMQVGSSTVEARPFEPADTVLFTGCRYAAGHARSWASRSDGGEEPAQEEGDGEPSPQPDSPEEMERAVLDRFRSLKYHHVEVLEDIEAKFQRLKTLMRLYDPTHETQVVVVAEPGNLREVARALGECLEECDYDCLELSTSQHDRQAIIEGYDTGNLYAVAMSSEVCARRGFELGKPAAVLVCFDCAPSAQVHIHRTHKRADSETRIHTFFMPSADSKIAVPLLKVLEEAGHEIPPELTAMWSSMDQKGACDEERQAESGEDEA